LELTSAEANNAVDIGPYGAPEISKRIACVFNRSEFQGGGEISFFELIKGLDRQKFNPLIIVPGEGEIAQSVAGLGLEVSICPLPPLKTIALGLPLWSLIRLAGILRSTCINLIHTNGSRACFYSGMAGLLLRIPMVWHVRETIQDIAFYDKLLARLSAAIICVSSSVKVKRFAKFGNRISDKIHIAYNGVDTQRFTWNQIAREKIRRQFGIEESMLFGIVGNLIPLKGHDFFLRSLALARKLRPDLAVKAILIGKCLDTEYEGRLRRLIVDLKLKDLVSLTGYAADVPAYLAALDVLALPSRREGCSRSLIEAMSIGLPVVASDIIEIEESVHSKKNAILVKYDDVAQMASGIIELAENKKLREDMGRENRKRAREMFSLKIHVDSIQRIYENELMKNGHPKKRASCN